MTSSALLFLSIVAANIEMCLTISAGDRRLVSAMERAASVSNPFSSVQESLMTQLLATSDRLGRLADATRRRLAASASAIEELEKKGQPISGPLRKVHLENVQLARVSAFAASTAALRANADYGPGHRLLGLATGSCVHSIPVVDAKHDAAVYSVCPFDNITVSFLLRPSISNSSDSAVSAGGDISHAPQNEGRVLGHIAYTALWKGWVAHASLPLHMRLTSLPVISPSLPKGSDGASDTALYFESMEACGDGNETHRMWLLLTCKEAFLQPAPVRDNDTSTSRPGYSHAFTGVAIQDGHASQLDVQSLMTILHPSLPEELIPSALNAVPSPDTDWSWLDLQLIMRNDGHGRYHGPVLRPDSDPVLLHVEQMGQCSTIMWLGSKAACGRRMLKAVRRTLQAGGQSTHVADAR